MTTEAVQNPFSEQRLVPGQSMLERNLRALAIRSPRVADAVRQAAPRAGLTWLRTEQDGAWSAELDGRALASKRRPLDEAELQANAVDFARASGVVVLGFGLGYHVAALSRRGGERTAIIVFEPDVSLLRSVLEHADLSAVLRGGLIFFFTDPDDGAAVNEALVGLEGLLSVGIEVVEHSASRARLGEAGGRFAATMARYAGAMRMQIVTTMMNMETTLRNTLMNLDEYAGGAGIAEIDGIAAGRPAIVVSAGPSLARNIALLEDTRVRERVIIIAVQTVLKPLLARGIRPHFVTALDFHEISTRFYEGLSEQDVRGVTLVAEPKANPAILRAFPGSVRLTRSDVLDWLLGDELRRDKGEVAPGATVAHLAYLLARHLGCDPVVLVGQDLAFTDGQYYAAGASIHEVWGTELGEFNTLETMEWQRIVRWRGHLHRATDHLGRSVYTDDQMSTYLAQFERMFLADAERGRTTIDATEGGAKKAYTNVMTLREALDRFAGEGAPAVPELISPARAGAPGEALKRRVRAVRDGARAVAHTCRETAGVLETMQEHQADQPRVNRLIDRVQELQERVKKHEPAYALVHRLNQTGAFKRFRFDRELGLDESLPPLERQKKQIERDRMNVTWLGDSADALDELLGATLAMLDGGPRLTRDPATPRGDASERSSVRTSVGAIIVDASAGGIDAQTLALTRARVERIAGLDSVDVVRIGPLAAHQSIRAGRAWARACWRGGLGHLSCYDEFFDPGAIARAMSERQLDAALLVGADWALVDPALCAAVVERHRESPETMPLVFTQAPPGLCGVVVSRRLCEELARGRDAGDSMATIGGMLGFNPRRPALDPVAKSCCVQIDGAVRGSPWRYVLDEMERPWLSRAMEGVDLSAASAGDVIQAASRIVEHDGVGLRHLSMTLGRGWSRDQALTEITRAADELGPVALTLRGAIDGSLLELIGVARVRGMPAHVRTDARCETAAIDALIVSKPDVVSIDLHASTRDTYAALTSGGDMDRALLNTERLLLSRMLVGGLPHPWIVPRITRRDAVYEEVEGFYDRGLVFASACVIDPLDEPIPGERIAPLPLPRNAALRNVKTTRRVQLGGRSA